MSFLDIIGETLRKIMFLSKYKWTLVQNLLIEVQVAGVAKMLLTVRMPN